ncbi:ABC transporter ATP-binding protein [candidate division WWE3 bacterium]|nr:ABC transporter ATP-binding protein [candidate division WWE3 bacterium]
MRKLFSYLKPYLGLMAILLVVTYLQVMANLKLPDYMAQIVNEGIIMQKSSAIYENGGLMLLVTLGAAVCSVIIGFLASRIATGYARDIRKQVFTTVESYSIAEFNTFSTSSLITRSTNDIQQIQMVMIMLLRMVLMAPFMAIGALQKAFITAPSMSWIIAIASISMLSMIGVLFSIALPKFQMLQKLVDRLNLVTRENLTGLRVVRAFNNEYKEEEKFEKANADLTDLNLYVNRLMIIMQPIMMLILNLSIVGIVWYGAKLIDLETIQIGDMLAFMQYAMQVIMSFLMISIIFIMVPRASVSAKRVAEVISTPSSILDPQKPRKFPKEGNGRVEFKEVTFSYPGADMPVLSGINFIAEPGQTTAFIGSTGSGKSTLINLIPRFYDVTAGQILIDGLDVREVKLEDLYKQIGYVPQKGVLFSGTIKSNIKYGNKKATEEDIEKSAQTAQATEFIEKLEKGYQNEISQGGSNVSGGQKQRLSIARALAVKPKLYIFDDSFSALDLKTDALLRQTLQDETKDRTVLIVGQRISTIMNADKIIVLDEGRIVGQGTHDELMQNNPVYQEIAYSQLSDTELKSISESHHNNHKGVNNG